MQGREPIQGCLTPLRDPAVECLVKAGCYQNDSVLYFCFCLCVMGKCLSNDDGYGDEKEMLNWRKKCL